MTYRNKAKEARKEILTLVHKAGTSHIASNFSVLDIMTVLYENLKQGDEVILSKGWAAASLYYFLWKQGKITREQLESFPKPPFYGLAETTVNGVLCSGGSMGHGLPIATGIAIGKKRAKEEGTIYCIMSDGEMQEGTTWESAQIAAQHKLDNLVVIIDFNKWTAMGKTEDVCNLEPFDKRWQGFNWATDRIDGHNHEQIEMAIKSRTFGMPRAIIADTIKGKGVKMFEDRILYHYSHVDKETYEKALQELNA